MSDADFENEFAEDVAEASPEGSGVTLADFRAYVPTHSYIFTPCSTAWVAAGVDACLPPVPVLTKNGQPKRDKHGKLITIPATRWLDRNQRVEGLTWDPGQPAGRAWR